MLGPSLCSLGSRELLRTFLGFRTTCSLLHIYTYTRRITSAVYLQVWNNFARDMDLSKDYQGVGRTKRLCKTPGIETVEE
jgi:hypothetical protein